MNTTRALIAFLILVSPLSSQAQSPELKVLQVEYDNHLSERVTGAYNEGLAKLDAGYLAGIDRVLASSKAAGDLEGALALEAEKKRVADKGPLPANDEQAAKALKSLRGIYRLELARLSAQRATSTATLLTPYIGKLKQLEADLTKADRLADAKAVMDYRQGVAVGLPIKTNVADVPTATQPQVPIGATPREGFTNSLDMKFVPVTGTKVYFCIHTTRMKDYAAYSDDEAGVNGSWKNQIFYNKPIARGDDYPVVGVSWEDANAFCAWLSKKEGRTYRLPTDREWSIAVGLGGSEMVTKDTTPGILNGKVKGMFPWGTKWPPPKDSGNYADTACIELLPNLTATEGGYADGYSTTSPVMSFKPNKHGLYDMGGNVWQWCEDWFDASKQHHVQRGGSFATGGSGGSHLSSARDHHGPKDRGASAGFRIVMDPSAR